jgi:hypothetical protein
MLIDVREQDGVFLLLALLSELFIDISGATFCWNNHIFHGRTILLEQTFLPWLDAASASSESPLSLASTLDRSVFSSSTPLGQWSSPPWLFLKKAVRDRISFSSDGLYQHALTSSSVYSVRVCIPTTRTWSSNATLLFLLRWSFSCGGGGDWRPFTMISYFLLLGLLEHFWTVLSTLVIGWECIVVIVQSIYKAVKSWRRWFKLWGSHPAYYMKKISNGHFQSYLYFQMYLRRIPRTSEQKFSWRNAKGESKQNTTYQLENASSWETQTCILF